MVCNLGTSAYAADGNGCLSDGFFYHIAFFFHIRNFFLKYSKNMSFIATEVAECF